MGERGDEGWSSDIEARGVGRLEQGASKEERGVLGVSCRSKMCATEVLGMDRDLDARGEKPAIRATLCYN